MAKHDKRDTWMGYTAKAYGESGGQNIPHDSFTTMALTEAWDIDGAALDAPNDELTPPVEGKWRITGVLKLSALNDGDTMNVDLHRNGSFADILDKQWGAGSSQNVRTSFSAVVETSDGSDSFTIEIEQDTGVDQTLSPDSWVSVELITRYG